MHPKMLFLRYAFACAEDLLLQKRLTEDAFRDLKTIIDNPTLTPGDSILRECFPVAYAGIRLLAEQNTREMWNMENVADFWRNRHGEHRTPVEILEIGTIRADGFVRMAGKEPRFFHNRYDLALKEGDCVRVHVSIVVEKI